MKGQQEFKRQLLKEEAEQNAREAELRNKENELKSIEAERLLRLKAEKESRKRVNSSRRKT